MAGPSYYTLGEVADRTRLLEIRCTKCPRAGRLALAPRVARLGRDVPIATVWQDLNADCANRDAGIYQQCHLEAPALPQLFRDKPRPD